jgi:hypothetical protein
LIGFQYASIIVAAWETLKELSAVEFFIDAPGLDSNPPYRKDINGYSSTAVGGTFDYLHAGHKMLLSMAALLSNSHVTVGVTGRFFFARHFTCFMFME